VKTDWRPTRLGDVLQLIRRSETVQPATTYDLIGVRLDGAGPFLRETKTGDQISAKQLFRVACGDFIYSRLFAWRGAFGTIGQGLEGRYVSGEFPTFVTNADRLDAEFLRLWFRLPSTLRTVESLCSGSTPLTRNRFKEQFFLDLEIPLPPLAEQQRIVVRIDALAARIDAAKGLRAQAVGEVEAVLTASMVRIWRDAAAWASQPIGKLIHLVSGQVDPTHEPYASLPHINGENIEAGTGRLLSNYRSAKDDKVISGKYRFPAGSVLYSKIRPYLRKAVLVPFEGICSADIYAIQGTNPLIEPGFLKYSLISLGFTSYANRLSGRTRIPKLNQKQLVAFELPYPSLEDQRKIVAHLDDLQARVDAVKRLQAETQAELDALLPALLDRAFRGEL
jgi:restriction endonuclease S subunit